MVVPAINQASAPCNAHSDGNPRYTETGHLAIHVDDFSQFQLP